MKELAQKIVLAICLSMICHISNAQTIIQMEEYGGVYRIPCKVNGAKMKLIFDTGAESVCLSLTMAEYLFDNDFISNNDIKGNGSSQVADGSIVDHIKINIKDIEIQGIHLKNVEAVVFLRQDTPQTCTGGFRSQDKVDVSAVASKFGGGGHKNAAGISTEGKIDTLVPAIVKEFARIM